MDLCMGRRPIYKSDEFFKSTPLVDQIYLDMTAVAHRTGVAPFGIRSPTYEDIRCLMVQLQCLTKEAGGDYYGSMGPGAARELRILAYLHGHV